MACIPLPCRSETVAVCLEMVPTKCELQNAEPRRLCYGWKCKQQQEHHEGALLTVMVMSADIAPTNTTNRACLIAMMAAMMKVSSPTSVTRICMQPGGQVQPVPARLL